jgi:hypothetical protein
MLLAEAAHSVLPVPPAGIDAVAALLDALQTDFFGKGAQKWLVNSFNSTAGGGWGRCCLMSNCMHG